MVKPIFYDPDRKRWKRIRTAFDVAGVLLTIVIVVFVVTVTRGVQLSNTPLLPEEKHPYRAVREREKKEKQRFVHQSTRKKKHIKALPQQNLNSEQGLRAGFYVEWDPASYASLTRYYQHLDLLFPEWLHVVSSDGRLQMPDAQNNNEMSDIITPTGVRNVDSRGVMPFLRTVTDAPEVLPLVNNFDARTNKFLPSVGDFLINPDSRATFISQVDKFLASDKYTGLSIDFEEIPTSAQPGYKALIHELYTDLHARGLKLFVNVPVDDNDYDYKFLAANVDGLVLMNYDQHQTESMPGPIAAQEWFVNNLRTALKLIPPNKIVCAIGNYAYDWTTKPGKKPQLVGVTTFTVPEAWLRARDSETEIDFDSDALNAHFSYEDEDTHLLHEMWMLDAASAVDQMRGANQLGINSFALWRIGSEDRSLWEIWDQPQAADVAQKLAVVPPGLGVEYEDLGEILHIIQKPAHGDRTIGLDSETNLIDEEKFTTLPLSFDLQRTGYKPRQIAITFDDGPDPKFTPQILDVLKHKNVKAAFFVIGIEGEKNSGLLRRIYDEGHEIGNHTFTHPDISNMQGGFMNFEMNATERLLESKLGVKPVFFRPPYSIDEEPEVADEVRPLEYVEDRGYITIGDRLDPHDWEDNPRPSVETIVNTVMTQLQDPRCGTAISCNILLLHDGGGDRSHTVAALPLIIDRLRAEGYEIVPVSHLIGKDRSEVMIPITRGERISAIIDGIAFDLFDLIMMGIVAIFFAGDMLMTFRLVSVGVLAVYDRFRPRPPAVASTPPVAVLIPAYNEEKVIERTVRAVLHSDYPGGVRAIVIDDGSADATYQVVKERFAAEIASGKVTLLTKPNSGKAHAANFGLQNVREEIFIAIDADTIIHPHAITRLVPHFADPQVAAVAGNAKVGNRVNIWTRWQALEYITSQNFERRALNALNAVSVVPGAIGAWRTQAVREAGLYPIETVAEDADLTMSLLHAGYKVQYEDRALAYTEAPLTPGGLMRQRFRWSFGILQAVWKHRRAFTRKGVLGWVALPNIVIFQIFLPLVSPMIDLMFAAAALSYVINRHYHPFSTSPASFEKLVLYFLLFLLIDFVASVVAFALEPAEARSREDKWLLSQVWLQRFAYRQLFSVVLFKTLKRAVDGRPFSWDKLERTATAMPG